MTRTTVTVGLPYSSNGPLAATAAGMGATTLISAGSLRRKSAAGVWRWAPIGDAAWSTAAALDSAGFVAMLQGGYRWDVDSYVEFVVTNRGDGSRPFPWRWWSAMDYCCEPEIASDRAEVERRIELTVQSLGDTLEALDYWRDEGVTDVPDPMPILQGRTADDYIACAKKVEAMLKAHGRTMPALVGVGSVCRRQLHGPEGLLTILEALDAALPAGVRLHLFGVKGDTLAHLAGGLGERVASIDSMAWDSAARWDALKAGESNTVKRRAGFMARWYSEQLAKLPTIHLPIQLSLFA